MRWISFNIRDSPYIVHCYWIIKNNNLKCSPSDHKSLRKHHLLFLPQVCIILNILFFSRSQPGVISSLLFALSFPDRWFAPQKRFNPNKLQGRRKWRVFSEKGLISIAISHKLMTHFCCKHWLHWVLLLCSLSISLPKMATIDWQYLYFLGSNTFDNLQGGYINS